MLSAFHIVYSYTMMQCLCAHCAEVCNFGITCGSQLYLVLDQQASQAAACLLSGARPSWTCSWWNPVGGSHYMYTLTFRAEAGGQCLFMTLPPLVHTPPAVFQGVRTVFATSPN
jgi:hypothetical protein